MIVDEGTQDKLFIKLTNHLTGEITEVEIESAEQAKNLRLELSASKSVIGKALDRVNNYLDSFLGNDQEYRFADGKILRRIQRETLIYRPETVKQLLKEHLDKDTYKAALDSIMVIDQRATKELVQEMMEHGELPGDTLSKIIKDADHKAQKPFVEVK